MSTLMLSRKSVSRIAKLCNKVKFNNSHNEYTIEMADGIAVFVQVHRYVSEMLPMPIVSDARIRARVARFL